jgi:5-formyltetrahydrofolate cyclo-ligase
LTSEQVQSRSSEVVERLMGLPEYVASKCIMLYWSCHNEVHTHPLVRRALEEGKKVLLPKCDPGHRRIYAYEVRDLSRDLEVGPFDILEPKEDSPRLAQPSKMDVCIVPGIAFDPEGNRIGRGLGYYDRFLNKLDEKTMRIGLAYAFQIVNKICPTDYDASMNAIVTEEETLVARRSVIR